MSARTTGDNVRFAGDWQETSRSISQTIPITASLNGEILSIQSSTQRSDITLRISKDGIALLEQTIHATYTHCIMIELYNFEPDLYTIELTNQWGDYLHGDFEKEY